MYDFLIFYQYGQSLWRGEYRSLYPLPLAGYSALWGFLPLPYSMAAFFLLNLALFVSIFKRKSLMWMFYAPAVQVFIEGQLDIQSLWLLMRGTPVALALMTLKPQVFVALGLPKLLSDRKLWPGFLKWFAVLYLPVTLARPTWMLEWFRQMDDGRVAANNSASLWSLLSFTPPYWIYLAVFGVVLLLAVKRPHFSALLLAFNPAIRSTAYTVIAGPQAANGAWLLIPLSWVCLAWSRYVGVEWPFGVLGVGAALLHSAAWTRVARPNLLRLYARARKVGEEHRGG